MCIQHYNGDINGAEDALEVLWRSYREMKTVRYIL